MTYLTHQPFSGWMLAAIGWIIVWWTLVIGAFATVAVVALVWEYKRTQQIKFRDRTRIVLVINGALWRLTLFPSSMRT